MFELMAQLGFDPPRACSADALFALSELAVVCPAALVATLPVREHLRVRQRTYLMALAILTLLLLAQAPLITGLSLPSNDVLIPACAVAFVVYVRCVDLPPSKSAAVFCSAMTLGAFITYAALIADVFCGDTSDTPYLESVGAIAQWALWAVALLILARPLQTQVPATLENNLTSERFWRLFWIFPLAVTIALVLLVPADTSTLLYRRVGLAAIIGVGGLFILTLMVYILISRLIGQTKMMFESQERANQLSMQLLMEENLEQRMETARRARHDLRQHDHAIVGFLDAEDYASLRDYLNEHQARLEMDVPLYACANRAVNAVAVYYWAEALSAGVAVDMALDIPAKLGATQSDVVVVLGNLLENAVEALAAMPAGKGTLFVHAGMQGDMLFIAVDNSYNTEPNLGADNKLVSTKHPGEGIGTQSVRTIAESHSGTVSFKYGDGTFRASVMMQL